MYLSFVNKDNDFDFYPTLIYLRLVSKSPESHLYPTSIYLCLVSLVRAPNLIFDPTSIHLCFACQKPKMAPKRPNVAPWTLKFESLRQVHTQICVKIRRGRGGLGISLQDHGVHHVVVRSDDLAR